MLAQAALGLGTRLGEVDAEGDRELVGERAAASQQCRVGRVRRVRIDGGADGRVAAPARGAVAGAGEDVVERRAVDRGDEAREAFAEERAAADLLDGVAHGVLEHVHVEERGAAVADELKAREARGVADALRRERRLGGEDVVLKPLHEREVVGVAAQDAHGDVRVAVDEAGEDHGLSEVADGLGGMAGAEIGGGADVGDFGSGDKDRAVAEDVARGVLGDDVRGCVKHAAILPDAPGGG